MHETVIVSHLIQEAMRAIDGCEAQLRVKSIRLEIGRLSCASPEALLWAFEALSAGTRLEGALLEIERPALAKQCHACGGRFEAEDAFDACPRCGALDCVVEKGGGDLILRSIALEE